MSDNAETLAALLRRLERVEAQLDTAPIVGWGRAAAALGVSTDTVARARKRAENDDPPWWSCRAALFDWWTTILEGPPAAPPRGKAARPVTGAIARRERLRRKYG